MTKGSFKGLHTFAEVGRIYDLDASGLRKQVSNEKLVEGVDIKKFGNTWLITEQCMIEKFGDSKFKEYKKKKKYEEKILFENQYAEND